MSDLRRPILAIHVVWHPDSGHGGIADALREHFNRERITGAANRMGVSVVYRSVAVSGGLPAPVEFDGSETNAVVLLTGDEIADSERWREYVNEINVAVATDRLRRRVFPVTVTQGGLGVLPDVQALRWDQWDGCSADRQARLVFDLTHEFAVMLRANHDNLLDPGRARDGVEGAQPVRVFLSHSKHDDVGSDAAEAVRSWLHLNSRLSSFFDIVDIPPGQMFADVLPVEVERSAVLATYSDTYSSRPWCQKEVLLAKEKFVPLVVASVLECGDERGFPYMGNVPVIPLSGLDPDSVRAVVGRLLDEVLRWSLWQCRTEALRRRASDVLFIPRPPELLTFAHLLRQDACPSWWCTLDLPWGEKNRRFSTELG